MMKRHRFFFFFSFFFSWILVQAQLKSPLDSDEFKNLSSAKRLEDVFEVKSKIQLETSAESAISYITDMEIDSRDNFIIADGWQSKGVYIFSSNGSFLKELGRQGQGPGEYLYPVSIDINKNGDIWVADYGGNRINIYAKDFKFVRSIIGRTKLLHYLNINSKDEIYMYRSVDNPLRPSTADTIFRYDAEGRKISSFAPFPEEVLLVKFWSGQDGMAIDKDDFVYELNPLLYRIQKFSPQGELIVSFSRKTKLFKIITKEGESPIIVYGPFVLDKGLVIAHVSECLEIYDTCGNFIVGEIPFSQRIDCTHEDSLYTEVWKEEGKGEIQLNPQIIRYKLKPMIPPRYLQDIISSTTKK
jgi:hypothetical protein